MNRTWIAQLKCSLLNRSCSLMNRSCSLMNRSAIHRSCSLMNRSLSDSCSLMLPSERFMSELESLNWDVLIAHVTWIAQLRCPLTMFFCFLCVPLSLSLSSKNKPRSLNWDAQTQFTFSPSCCLPLKPNTQSLNWDAHLSVFFFSLTLSLPLSDALLSTPIMSSVI